MIVVGDVPMFAATHVLMFVVMARGVVVVLVLASVAVPPYLNYFSENGRPI